jgi:hypothetical protein
VVLEGIKFSDNNIQSIVTDSNITLVPQGTGGVIINSNQSIQVPVGTIAQQPGTPSNGMIRYNSDLTRYEGYNNGYWVKLGGLQDVDGNTKIIAEATPGANDNTLYFYADGNLTATIDSTKLFTQRFQTVNLDLYSNTITPVLADSNLNLTTTGIGLQVSGGPITTAGNINIINTGVTRLSAGTGINLSGSNGNVTVSSTSTGVTSVGLSSSSLTVTNSPITTTGTIVVEIPANVAVSGKLLLSGSENLASGSAANLDVTASYFSTVSPSTATLAAGTTGQIKTFMMVADIGDMVITVTNAGWKTTGTGTITFGDRGAGCTLQYINSKWFCIGQNGVTFA